MSIKDIWEWIINVNLFYVAGAIFAYIAISHYAKEFAELKKDLWDPLDNWKDKLGMLFVIFIVCGLAYVAFGVIREEFF